MYSYEALNPDNDFAVVHFMCYVQFIEVFTFTLLLYIFYPRKEWPDYFSLGLGTLAADAQRQAGNQDADLANIVQNMVPIAVSRIDNNLLNKGGFIKSSLRESTMKNKQNKVQSFGSNDSFSSFGSMGTDEAIIIVNPNEYTIQSCESQFNLDIDKSEEEAPALNNPYKNADEENTLAI